ncbi:flagellar FlbD family protein [Bacillus sp. RG28]|uniref:Flagellar FlbD family protein n=1 Tax=Gottfriedia endophytica TaxID=2820819 RepID=A0A940NRI7_9BACI|nr:flagellar FlbD family protein [Gottfriedia endophytica]MBP0726233.1 flagellar FlbD family protein [Gottfriedia endophytica]
MINLTKLNGQTFTLNAIYIEEIQSFPDTTITLANGHKFLVKESEQEVTRLITDYYKVINLLGTDKKMEG